MAAYSRTESGLSRFWEAYPSMPPEERYRNLRDLYSSLREKDFVTPSPDGTLSPIQHLLLCHPLLPHSLVGIPQDLIITPKVSMWVTTLDTSIHFSKRLFPRIDLTGYKYTRIFTERIHLALHNFPDASYRGELHPIENESAPIEVHISHIHDTSSLHRLLELFG